jgi:hypothetical protein
MGTSIIRVRVVFDRVGSDRCWKMSIQIFVAKESLEKEYQIRVSLP